MTFIFGIIITTLIFFFFDDIQAILVSTGIRDSLVLWLQRW